MKYSKLKKSNFEVSAIGLGTNAVGGHNLFENLNEEDGKDLVRAALNHGVNFIDTADIYGFGRSEELVGEVLKEFNREDYVIATKGARNFLDVNNVKLDNRPEYIRTAIENSLKRLQLDYVDLYYLHFPDGETPLSESVDELALLKQEGKIRSIGISNVTIDQLKEANANGDISVVQQAYSMLDRSVEKDILPYIRENNISFIPYGPLAFGLLGGGFTKDTELDASDWRRSKPFFAEENYSRTLDTLKALKEFAHNKGVTLPNLALAWLLAQNGIDAVIPGGKRKERIIENIKAADIHFSGEELKKIDSIINQ